jgi:hypothetical protein
MVVQDWKKIIVIFVVVAFIGIGVAWAMEQGSPQFPPAFPAFSPLPNPSECELINPLREC